MDKTKLVYEVLPILGLLVVIAVVVLRLPRVEVGHSDAFRKRRFFNWFPLGLAYAFLYMGRYNLNTPLSLGVLSAHDYGTIVAVGSWVYGCSFLLNGPLADRFGGKTTILAATFGSATMNALMGLAARASFLKHEHTALVYSLLYGANMYFQSFGAVSIIKVNSAWFHVRERGVFGGIFGILISLGLYFAYDWCPAIASRLPLEWVFFMPALVLFAFFAISLAAVRDTPGAAGFPDFDTGDASSGDIGARPSVGVVLRKMLTNPVILTIALIEMCSGFLRDSMMHWYKPYAVAIGAVAQVPGGFDQLAVKDHWGMLTCSAGILGGTFAGIISDRVFQSRRPPVAAVLYTNMLVGSVALFFLLVQPLLAGGVIIFMVMSVLGVHGVLSGTASADFGGKKNAGVATGIIDGFVYAGVGAQSLLMGHLLPDKKDAVAGALIQNWRVWPAAMFVVALVGLILATRVWNAKPKGSEASLPSSKRPRRANRDAQSKVLDQAVEAARAAGSKGLVAFDLDSTLFDNRPRQAAILNEWAKARGIAGLGPVEARHVDGWDLRVALVNAGLPAAKAEELFPDAKSFWRERFFTSEWCRLDVAIPGAVSFVSVLQETGAQIAYVTGRDEGMLEGTVECLKKCGFPAPDGKTVHAFLKPVATEDDDAWKERALPKLAALGRVVAAFENEPTHANAYKRAFPDAHVVHLDTDSSGRPVEPLAEVPSVLDFLRV